MKFLLISNNEHFHLRLQKMFRNVLPVWEGRDELNPVMLVISLLLFRSQIRLGLGLRSSRAWVKGQAGVESKVRQGLSQRSGRGCRLDNRNYHRWTQTPVCNGCFRSWRRQCVFVFANSLLSPSHEGTREHSPKRGWGLGTLWDSVHKGWTKN